MESIDLKELVLKKVKINGNIIGKFGVFEIEQTYKNNTRNILEVSYTFPIVETATVVGFEINVANKVLKGKCKEKGEAKREYQKNIVEGNSTYLMEQNTNNVFQIAIGKINTDEEVKVKIKYIDKFDIVDNTIKILIPTLVTPKYKSNITRNLTYGETNYTVDFSINIDKMLNKKRISSQTHKINVIDEEKSERIEVINYDLSKDFKLDIELKNQLSSNAIKSKTRDGKDMIYLSFMPEITDIYEDNEKEYLFIVDVSGSMMGRKLKETKRAVIECLKQLDVGDKFNIIPFESCFEAMNITSIEYNEENMKKAIEYINNLKSLGGTEILEPLKFALYEKNTDKVILLFTDGQVGNENEIIKYVEDNISKSRIFPFGIDTNVNSSFIKELARSGNGKAELIRPEEKIDDKIIRAFARIQTPLLEKIEIDYGTNKVIDEIREENSLFNYEFFNVFAKVEALQDDIKLKGKILDKEYIWEINKEKINNTNVDLEVIYAKQEMERIEEYIRNTYEIEKIQNYKKMIIEISKRYNINSKYTSFITVHERESKLFGVPKCQEIVLSNKFEEEAFLNRPMGDRISCMKMKNNTGNCNDVDIPSFLRKNNTIKFSDRNFKKEENIDKIKTEVDKYYEIFIVQKQKNILTYLLFAIYYIKIKNKRFNYDELLRFLRDNRENILANELYMKLIYLCYITLEENRWIDKKETLELLDENYKKVVYTKLKINTDIKTVTDADVENIIKNDKIIDEIDDVIWYLYKNNI